MNSMHLHIHHEAKLKCPYKGCGKSFERPAVLTDSSTLPRKTNYACPFCMSKIDLTVENLKVVDVKPLEYPKVFDSPAKCAHYSGLLDATLTDRALPEECLICPKVLQCMLGKK
jgi:hypothetical protein